MGQQKELLNRLKRKHMICRCIEFLLKYPFKSYKSNVELEVEGLGKEFKIGKGRRERGGER